MNHYSYNMIKYLYDMNSQYKRANNMVKVMYGYMTLQQMFYEECKDAIMKRILFG